MIRFQKLPRIAVLSLVILVVSLIGSLPAARAASFSAAIVSFGGGGCGILAGSTGFTILIQGTSLPAGTTATASILSGPAGLSGTSVQSLPAGSTTASAVFTFSSVQTNAPWSFIMRIDVTGGGQTVTLGANVTCGGSGIIGNPYGVVPAPIATAANAPTCLFTDGRVNCRAEDAAQTAAIYCTGDGGVTIFAVNNSVGKFAFTATAAEIAKVPANPDKNTLIKEALNISLWRLRGGKLQVNAPNDYVYTWGGC